jgi:ABC-type hemin transport system substrate-binding protein
VRVVSLVPSITETLLAWGVDVVACTRFCEQPALAHVGGTKDPDIAAIVALAPDLVVLDREENRREDAEAMVAAGLRVHVTHVTGLDSLGPALAGLAEATGAGLTSGPVDASGVDLLRRTAIVPIWRRPWMLLGADTYGAGLLASIGVATLPGPGPDRYPMVDPASFAGQVDLVVLPSEPYPFADRHMAEVAGLVPGAQVVLVDGRDLLWWGMRTPGAAQRLRAVLRAVTPPG